LATARRDAKRRPVLRILFMRKNGLFQALAVGAVLSLTLTVGCGGSGATDASSQADLVGNPAPDFSAPQANGSGQVSLKALQGRVVLLDFWGTYCEPCKKSFPKLQDLYAKYKPQLAIIGISEDDEKDPIQGFVDTYNAKFTIAWDDGKAVAPKYHPKTMPSSFIIDKKGIVRYAHIGYHDGEEVEIEKEVKGLLDEK
jgi:cytochrome c biogenesis protein CcmG/thiol:disulfide interchange protein DsbE